MAKDLEEYYVETTEETPDRLQEIIDAGENLVEEIQKVREGESSGDNEYTTPVEDPDKPEKPEIDWPVIRQYAIWGGAGLVGLWLIPKILK